MPLCQRTNLEVNMIYDSKKQFDKFNPRQNNTKFCEFWNMTTGFCSKDQKKCNKGKPLTPET